MRRLMAAIRICFFGDSFVNGAGDDECLGWPGRLCSAARRAGQDITCYNLGIRGDNSADIAARWRREAEVRLPPDYDGRIVFSFGTNDGASDGTGGVTLAHEQALENAYAILSAAVAWRPTLMVGPAPVSDDPRMDRHVKALSVDLGGVCRRVGVPYLAVFDAMAGNAVWTREAAIGDGTHPNGGGYAALARVILAWNGWRAWFNE